MNTFRFIIDQVSMLAIPLIFVAIIGYAMAKRVKVYESFVAGGKEGFTTFTQILPYLVAIFAAIGMFRASGAMDFLCQQLAPITLKLGVPAEVLPVAMMRPLSGSGALGLASDIIKDNPDSFDAKLASTIYGSTDTTFYVIAVYFGAVGIRRIRHAMVTGLLADLCGIIMAVLLCRLMFM